MTVPRRYPCAPWSDTVGPLDPGALENVDDATVTRATKVATELLWALSGRRFGTCAVGPTFPCQKRVACEYPGSWSWWGSWPPFTVTWPDAWLLDPWCGACRRRSCGCASLEELRLPKKPVTAVTEVIVDGAVLAPTAYRVDNWSTLVRLDGGSWPTCQDLEHPSFSVEWSYGHAVPEAGVWAAERLGAEILRLMVPELGECEIPQLAALSRAGETMTFVDPQLLLLNGGMTGITEVDWFLRAYNPKKIMRRARVYRADTHASMRSVDT